MRFLRGRGIFNGVMVARAKAEPALLVPGSDVSPKQLSQFFEAETCTRQPGPVTDSRQLEWRYSNEFVPNGC